MSTVWTFLFLFLLLLLLLLLCCVVLCCVVLCWFPPVVTRLRCSSDLVVLISVDSLAYVIRSYLIIWCCSNLLYLCSCSRSTIPLVPWVLMLLGLVHTLAVAPLLSGWFVSSGLFVGFFLSVLMTLIVLQCLTVMFLKLYLFSYYSCLKNGCQISIKVDLRTLPKCTYKRLNPLLVVMAGAALVQAPVAILLSKRQCTN